MPRYDVQGMRREDPDLVFVTKDKLCFLGFLVVAVAVGVGLVSFYLPHRECRSMAPIVGGSREPPTTTKQATSPRDVTESPRSTPSPTLLTTMKQATTSTLTTAGSQHTTMTNTPPSKLTTLDSTTTQQLSVSTKKTTNAISTTEKPTTTMITTLSTTEMPEHDITSFHSTTDTLSITSTVTEQMVSTTGITTDVSTTESLSTTEVSTPAKSTSLLTTKMPTDVFTTTSSTTEMSTTTMPTSSSTTDMLTTEMTTGQPATEIPTAERTTSSPTTEFPTSNVQTIVTTILPTTEVLETTEITTVIMTEMHTSSITTLSATSSDGQMCQNDVTTTMTSTASPSTSSDDLWPGRLPTDIMPHSYKLFLKPYINEGDIENTTSRRFTFDGKVTIRVVPRAATNRIVLHSVDIVINQISVTAEDGQNIFNCWAKRDEFDFLNLKLTEVLEVGKMYDVNIDYLGELNNGLSGFYRSSYVNATGHVIWGATSQMQPTDARRALPCFDEPALKAMFNVTIEHRSEMVAITNGKEIESVDLDNGWTRTTYEPMPPMSTYLLAFTVGVFDFNETTTAGGIRLRTWSRPEAVASTAYALDVGSRILTYFEQYFGIPFPLPKMDMIAVPDFSAGAMENWGLIIYRETAMLYDPAVNSASSKQRVATVISHELAHMWFGNLVTPKWWDDLWLNEGFASYVEYLGVDHVEPEWGMMEQFLRLDLHRALRLDSLGSSHPIKVDVNSPAEINEIFDAISYSKGASILRMLNNILTEDVFKAGLTSYLEYFAYNSATSDDLWQALTEADKNRGGNNVSVIMDTWTLQMGYPLLTLERQEDDLRRVLVHQEHYLDNPALGVDPRFIDLGYHWWVYVQYTYHQRGDFENPLSLWLRATESDSLLLGSDSNRHGWYLVNTHQYGYYRVNYDLTNWDRLSEQLYYSYEEIPSENRAQLINDAFTLAKTGNLSYSVTFYLIRYLGVEQEQEYLPWDAILEFTDYFAYMFRRSGGYQHLQTFMRNIIEPVYTLLGWEDSSDIMEQYTRNRMVKQACFYRIEDCLNKADEMFSSYMANPDNNTISNNLKNVVYCTAIREGGEQEWDLGWNRFLETTDSWEKSYWLTALGCSRQPWILHRYLLRAVEEGSPIRTQDVSTVIRAVAANHVGINIAWDFVRNEWQTIFDLFGGSAFSFSGVISSVSSYFNTERELQELLNLGEDRDFGSGTRTYQQAIDKTRTNIQWMEDYEDVITQLLMEFPDNQLPQ